MPVAGARARRNHRADGVVEGDEPGGVPLPKQHQRQGGDQPAGIVEVGKHGGGISAPGHRAGCVADHDGAEVGLLLELLDVEPVVAAEYLPVDVAELVARLVHAVFREFDGETPAGRAVQAREKALDHSLGHDFEAAKTGDFERVEQVETYATGWCSGSVHPGRNVFGGGGGVNATGGWPARDTAASQMRDDVTWGLRRAAAVRPFFVAI